MIAAENKLKSVLLVDDEKSILEFLEIMLGRCGYEVVTVDSGKKAVEQLQKRPFDVVITDILMPQMNGIELLQKVKHLNQQTAVIVVTAHGTTETAVEAMKLGASDYLTKPFEIEEMKRSVASAIRFKEIEEENRRQRNEPDDDFSFESIIGKSEAMTPIFDLVKRVAPTKTNIMILGESGTGKEMIAHAIHRNGPAPSAPFVIINCAAVPESLFESELFGHKKGAFTGAVQDKPGFFSQANGGTLFLDEVGEIPLSVQVKLLRAIQQKSFRPVGGSEDETVDVRIICATNRDLEKMVAKGEFREDLFYRLNVIQIRMPALRERKSDIPLLASHFLSKYSLVMGKPVKSISQDAMKLLMNYDFPGNVRELENVIERAVALEVQSSVSPENLPQKLLLPQSAAPSAAEAGDLAPGQFDLEKGVEEFERRHILQALEAANGVKKKAAKLLGISFRSLRYRIEKYKIDDPNPEESE